MPNTQTDNQAKKIIALAPSRKAIGVAVVDGVGVAHLDLLRLSGRDSREKTIFRVRTWLSNLLNEFQPATVVVENLSSKRATRFNLMLKGVLEATAGRQGYQEICRFERKAAVDWFCQREGGLRQKKIKRTLREAAKLLVVQCPELTMHRPPTYRYRTNWDRTWGQTAAAAVLALYARHVVN